MMYIYNCNTQEETQNLARALSEISTSQDIWALFGTLGVGKSVFSRAFIKNLTSIEEVPSPTFTLVQVYEAPSFDIYHYDLYRLKSAEEIWELNIEEAFAQAVSLVEWPEKMGPYLPRDCFKVNIVSLSQDRRRIEIEVKSEKKKNRLLKAKIKPDIIDDK
ncbi:MAG: tRNA (adenosine(37)-N6)-threonylcarbamoyltransferase complex ATPase subunit type 1 TsaE [Alphaproteobacteria bacterium]|nr:tRNA (adenosine(37)-N6)-threonylcarbamoyltransferase complex ATPase subunit type 1 TsaE [Alphaproteobacteria bacterium]